MKKYTQIYSFNTFDISFQLNLANKLLTTGSHLPTNMYIALTRIPAQGIQMNVREQLREDLYEDWIDD